MIERSSPIKTHTQGDQRATVQFKLKLTDKAAYSYKEGVWQ